MFDDVLEIIKKAGIFLIFAQTILHLCVSDAYEKYIKMMVGLITAIMLVFPVIEQLREGGFQDFESYRTEYELLLLGGTPDYEEIQNNAWENWLEENVGGAEPEE